MIVQYVENPQFANESLTLINCNVKFAEFDNFLPFTASGSDPMQYGRQIYANLVNGVYGPIAPYVAP
jgi:hypothetical protein